MTIIQSLTNLVRGFYPLQRPFMNQISHKKKLWLMMILCLRRSKRRNKTLHLVKAHHSCYSKMQDLVKTSRSLTFLGRMPSFNSALHQTKALSYLLTLSNQRLSQYFLPLHQRNMIISNLPSKKLVLHSH